ncbi:LysR family transcriptional regulator [Brachybacterium sp. ACRRE]|uniref:LysR family transcriptional regulator n=1 Tax=Brachybacterium sp. ACRRE TaxID=2918184 RepID=UPI001EF16CB7|nr:LysR family transcriptional regulator [Brachybacterium sp. ACRRE]MCG7310339.1 LysR family transcriptional regulator [Brachybacterium sp. ACRRE]
METRQLYAVLAVADAGSVTRAALTLRLVQPAVTRQIKQLEAELGVELFERTRSGMRPTAAGEKLVVHARRAVAELERARAAVASGPDVLRGPVTIGLLDSVTDLLAAPLVDILRREHPHLELRIVSEFAGQLRQLLYDGELDAAILFGVDEPTAFVSRPVAREQMWAAAASGEGLEDGSPVPFSEVARHPLLLPLRGNAIRSMVDQAAAQAGVEPEIVVEADRSRVLTGLAAAGHGWTILPAVCLVDDDAREHLAVAPIADEEMARTLVLARPRTARENRVGAVVVEAMERVMRDAATDGRWAGVTWSAPSQG